jgi:hypothetical protein
MKTRIARYLFAAVGFAGLAGTSTLYAGELGRDYHRLAHENARGRYRDAVRTRVDLDRDYYRRDRQLRDIYCHERFRNGWR